MTIAGLASLLSGCSTVVMRAIPENRGHLDYYPATQYDAFMIRTGGSGADGKVIGQSLAHPVAIPLHVLDIPISIVADTIMLPLDMRRKTQLEAERSLIKSRSENMVDISHKHEDTQ